MCTGARDPCFTIVKHSSNVVTTRETLTSGWGRLLQHLSNVSPMLPIGSVASADQMSAFSERCVAFTKKLSLNVNLRRLSCGGEVLDGAEAEICPPSNTPSILCSSKLSEW